MLTSALRRRSKAVAMAGLALASAAAVSIPLTAAVADTTLPAGSFTITASTATQTNVAPNGPLTGLVDGQNVSVNVHANGTPAGNAVFGVDARLCKPGLNISLDAQFDPSAFTNCVAAPLSAGSDDFISVATAPPNTDATVNFRVGTGTAAGGFNCGVGNPCALWLKLYVPTSTVASGLAFVHYDLQYAGAPGAPTGLAATPGSSQVGLSWTAPASDGGSAIDYYTVSGTFPGSPINTPTNATTFTVPGLTNFTSYDFSVAAHNASGFTGAAAGPVSATPAPPAPTGVSAIPGDQSAQVSWTAPASGGAPDSYTVTASPGGATCTTTSTSCTVSALTNGTPYTFTVQAFYGANGGQVSAASAPVTPNGTFVTQVITAARPAGTLDIAEACATGGTVQFGTYPQTCTVDLGTAVLNATSTYYVATGNIQTVSVRDLRDTDTGWNVNTQLSNFSSGTDSFAANCLEFTPGATELSNSATYTQLVTAAAPVVPANPCTGTGLVGATVMSAAATGGLGLADLDGPLTLNIPVAANAGTYSATLTFTVLGN